MADTTKQTNPRLGEHAIVIGASLAGLFAARVLSDFYGRVTVIERDELPALGATRRAVPQGRHAHPLHAGGQRAIKQLFPGIVDDVIAAGGLPYRAGPDLRYTASGHRLPQLDSKAKFAIARRPLLEGVVLQRVRELPNVEIRERCGVVGLVSDRGRVAGVRTRDVVRNSLECTLRADLVVAASGRGGRVPAWLLSLGFEPPAEERVAVDVLYVSRRLRLQPGALAGAKLIADDARADRPRGMFMAKEDDGDRWTLTLQGYGRAHRPPTDDAGFNAFLATVADPDVVAAVQQAEPLGEIASHAFPAGLRRRYEKLRRFPEGLLVIGDALCSFNPVHGQGMSVAALEAMALWNCLRDGEHRLARRYFKAATVPVDHAWKLAKRSDLAKPYVTGPATPADRLFGRYLQRVLAVAEHDDVVARAFAMVVGMMSPPKRIMAPAIARRVLRPGATRGRALAPAPGVVAGSEAPANA